MRKKKGKPSRTVRISLRTYELIRRMAFKTHKPMIDIIEEWANKQKL